MIVFTAWAIEHRSKNKIDGARTWFAGAASVSKAPVEVKGCRIMLFSTKAATQAYIRQNFAHLKRKDLRAEPHGWLMPRAVKVRLNVEYHV